VSAIQQKLDKLDEAFLYSEAIDVTTYGRQRDKLREELTLAKIDHHAEAVDELDVEGILAFAERILPRASDLWVQASLDYKQRLQQLFFPEGIAFDGNRFNRTAVTAPLFNYLARSESADERAVSQEGIEPSTRRLRVGPRHASSRRNLRVLRFRVAKRGKWMQIGASQAHPNRSSTKARSQREGCPDYAPSRGAQRATSAPARAWAAPASLTASYNVSGAMSAPFGHTTVPPSMKNR
jgi:hypothetical protein